MEMKNHSMFLRFTKKTRIFYSLSVFFLFVSVYGVLSSFGSGATCLDMIRCPFSHKADIYSQESIKRRLEAVKWSSLGKRFGPGSTPPHCWSKCGMCTPCRPVHVPVPPGTPVTTEYYPEAWRCKCANKLFPP